MNEVYITATGKKDGLGSQVLSKILGMIYCLEKNFTYVHTPLKYLDVRGQDLEGIKYYNNNKDTEWIRKWEQKLNLGKKYLLVDKIKYDKIIDFTRVSKCNQIKKTDNYLWHNFDPTQEINKYLSQYQNKKILFLIKEFPKIDTYINSNTDLILDNLRCNYIHSKLLFNKNKINIVIHKRHTRDSVLTKTTDFSNPNNRVTLNKYFINKIFDFEKNNKEDKYEYWIFSDGNQNNFPEFKFLNNREAYINKVKVNMMLQYNSLETFNHFINADILILDKSSFGYTAGLYNKNKVIYYPYWDKKYYKFL